jgi:hypothetical protein
LRGLDFSSWQTLLSTVVGLSVITLIAVGIRLLVMQTVQQRRERENRQVNERLKILIAAYKILGGSFTGDLGVNPAHLRDLGPPAARHSATDRPRRIRDAVEAALSDVILLGTEEQVRLAAFVAQELAAGRVVQTAELVAELRNFIRSVLGLEAVPADVVIPEQGPTRLTGSKDSKDTGPGGNKQAGKNLDAGGNTGGGMGGGYVSEDSSESHHDA